MPVNLNSKVYRKFDKVCQRKQTGAKQILTNKYVKGSLGTTVEPKMQGVLSMCPRVHVINEYFENSRELETTGSAFIHFRGQTLFCFLFLEEGGGEREIDRERERERSRWGGVFDFCCFLCLVCSTIFSSRLDDIVKSDRITS